MRFLFFVILYFTFISANAQSNLIKGKVVDEIGAPVADVVIANLSTRISTSTGINGQYEILVKKGDSIKFQLLGYVSRIIVYTGENNGWFSWVALAPERFIIDTIIVNSQTKYQKDSIERRAIFGKSVDYRPAKVHYSLKNPFVVQAPISGLLEKRTKKYKRIKAFQKMFREDETRSFVNTRYNKDTVAALTNLQGDSLSMFMQAFPIDYSFSRAATNLEIKMWIKYNYREWKANNFREVNNIIPNELTDTLRKP